MSQQPHGMSTLADMIQSSDVYECFGGNTVEVDIMLEYLETQRLTPRHIYREVSVLLFLYKHSCSLLYSGRTVHSETTARLCDPHRARIVH